VVIRCLRRTFAGCLAGIVVVVLGAAPAGAVPRTHLPARLQRALDEVVAAGAPGAIALVRTGGTTIRLVSGDSNLAPVVPMRRGLRYRIGGITKSFTAAVVLQLVAEGRLALGDTLEQRLPSVISNGAAITIRQLLNHTSGIYDYAQDSRALAPYLTGDYTRTFDPRDGVRYADEHGPLFPPGTALAYSNTNYLLLAMIVEAVTGRSFGSELRRRLFGPLGLGHTSYPTSSRIVGPHVHGYLVDDPPAVDVTALSPTLYGASGAILSTAGDLARFYRALLRGRLLSDDLLAQMKTIDPVATGGTPDAGILGGGWGLGLLREDFPCGPAWGHDSEIPGYTTAAWNSDDAGRQVTVVNSNFDHDASVNQAIRKVLIMAYCDT
jgi:D-alanyl-D-alanine carboxypeptidase